VGWLKRTFIEPDISRHLLRDEGEDIVDVVRKHWVVYIFPVLIAYLALVAFAAFLFSNLDIAWLPLLVGLVLLGWGASRALAHHLDCFVITNMRVFRIHGVLSRSLATMPLGRILDIAVVKPLPGRILGYGHFTFESAAQSQGLQQIKYVARPDERDLAIQRVVQRAGLRGNGPQLMNSDLQPGGKL
jgi:PH (Pleckstrin Homology) domain-containing protein